MENSFWKARRIKNDEKQTRGAVLKIVGAAATIFFASGVQWLVWKMRSNVHFVTRKFVDSISETNSVAVLSQRVVAIGPTA
jgi:hypothetical protein